MVREAVLAPCRSPGLRRISTRSLARFARLPVVVAAASAAGAMPGWRADPVMLVGLTLLA